MNVLLDHADFGQGYELFPANRRLAERFRRETGNESVLFQSDWDFPRLAENLGWSLSKVQRKRGVHCAHGSTDGTVACPACGLGAGAFIKAAAEYLDGRCGDTIRASVEYYFEQ